MLEIGSLEPLEAFFSMLRVLSKLEIFDLEFISIIAADTDNKSNLLSILNLSLDNIKPFSLSVWCIHHRRYHSWNMVRSYSFRFGYYASKVRKNNESGNINTSEYTYIIWERQKRQCRYGDSRYFH